MLRLILFLVGVIAAAAGLSWLADRPGLIQFNWEGYEGEISVFHAVVAAALLIGATIFLWSLIRTIWVSPAVLGRFFFRRRQKRGLEALSSGIIAIGAGDKANAMRYAVQARKALPNEPLTHLLRAQAAQLSGDKATARRIFESMLTSSDTEQLGLRGLFLEAQREGETEAAKQFAERALALNPQLAWSAEALFDLQCKQGDWAGALASLASAKKFGHVEKQVADRRRAVLLTAKAQAMEDSDSEKAMSLALEAHNLAPGLVPATAIAARILAARGNTSKAAKIIQKTWLKSPHPDLATAYAYARIGDSPRDRLERVRQLAALTSNSIESPIAVARTAIEAKDFDAARTALEPLLAERLTQRVATLMARIEAEQHGDKGRVREWLARAVNAPRDPVWIADGVVSETWAPVSPVTGQLDAFEWRVPVDTLTSADTDLVAQQIEKYAALNAPRETVSAGAADPAENARDITAASAAAVASAAQGSAVSEPARPSAADVAPAAAVKAVEPPPPAAPAATQITAAPATGTATIVTATEARPSSPAPATAMAAAADAKPAVKPEAKPSSEKSIAASATSDGTAVTIAGKAASAPAVIESGRASATASGDAAATTAPTAPSRSEASPAGALVPADRGQAATASLTTAGKKAAMEPAIFISPRAPDDPGPDSGDVEDVAPPPRQRYGTPM